MERQLLCLLDWDLSISQHELLSAWKRFLDPIRSDLKKQSKIRNNISKGMLAGSTQTIIVPANNNKTQVPTSAGPCIPTVSIPQVPLQQQAPVAPVAAAPQRVPSRMTSISSLSSVMTTPSATPEPHSRSSSLASLDSTLSHSNSMDSLHSRASSVSSVSSADMNAKHYQTFKTNNFNTGYNNSNNTKQLKQQNSIVNLNNYSLTQFIDSVASREEQELNNLMRQYCGAH
ncbi:unnamed protein product [Ambrosiozyma monospora]|uniref:Unnamed protein product n=1 Tax=Ambrosiozyma monospora TaxID=43982 RepID=A0ACB5TI54_AMBMO|nr:unnamed protein product [Ambrosiozyma monospora]